MSSTSHSAERANVYTRITAEIIAAIEAGAGEWRMPWHHDGTAVTRPENISSGKRYRGVNVLALWIAAQAHGYADGYWGTYRQWLAIGAQVRKGERGATVVLWKQAKAAESDDAKDGDDDVRRRVFARAFTVFNVAQVDGYRTEPAAKLPESDRLTHVDAFINALNIPIVIGNYDAHYRIDLDTIFMPEYSAFTSPAAHAGTLIHETAHATGAKHRLDRNFHERFKRDWLPIEEATAELTASFILADLGVAYHPRPDHAAYVASWLRLLKDDPRAIFTAASKAQQAADWMHAQQADPHQNSERCAA
jgi:antirestriction protein ArdC